MLKLYYLCQLLFRYAPAFQDVVDTELTTMGMDPRSNQCIGMHVRHGDACYAGGHRLCVRLESHLAVARQMRLRYGLKKVYLLTDDPHIAKGVVSGEYTSALEGLEVIMQSMNRDVYDGPENQNEFADQMGSRALTEMLVDITAASTCEAFVGSSSSGI